VRQHVVCTALGLVVVALFVGYAARFYYRVDFVTRFDHLLYDTRLRLTAPGGIDDDRIVILDIDERSLATPELGRWPWGRDVQARLVRKLFEKYGVALVAFDVVNGERDRSSGLPVLERLATGELKDVREFQEALERVQPRLDHDGEFAAAIKGRPVVLGFYFTNPETEANGTLPAAMLDGSVFRGRGVQFARYTGFGANLPEFQAAALAAGHFTPLVDEDGIIRRVPMLAEFKGQYYEPLSLAVFRALTGAAPVEVNVGDMGSRLRKAYTVMGDAVNLSSRVEGLTKEYGAPIIVGPATREAVRGIVFRELDRVRVKGKDEPVAIFEPIGPENEVGRERVEELKLWGQALKLYRARSWDQAELILFNLQRLYPRVPLYSLYADRVARYRHESPGPGWDGVTSFETK